MPQIKCSSYWSPKNVAIGIEGLRCAVPSIYQLPFIDVIGCFVLQVLFLFTLLVLILSLFWLLCMRMMLITFTYSKFVDESLSTTAASCPRIESLILSSCLSIGSDGLSSLHWLRRLTLLDLSYTFLMNLQPVFDSCSQLVVRLLKVVTILLSLVHNFIACKSYRCSS